MDSINQVVLLGAVRNGPWHRPAADKRPEHATIVLSVEESSKEGRPFYLYVRVDGYGKMAHDMMTLHAGDSVAVVGKLAWSKDKAGKSALYVLASRVSCVGSAITCVDVDTTDTGSAV